MREPPHSREVAKARDLDIDYLRQTQVYDKVPMQEARE